MEDRSTIRVGMYVKYFSFTYNTSLPRTIMTNLPTDKKEKTSTNVCDSEWPALCWHLQWMNVNPIALLAFLATIRYFFNSLRVSEASTSRVAVYFLDGEAN